MTHTILVNDSEFQAFNWTEAAAIEDGASAKHARNLDLLVNGVSELAPGEAYFLCDQTFAFDTTFSLKGDGRKFVVIASQTGAHVAKPY